MTEVQSQSGGTVVSRFASTLDPIGNPTQVVRTGSLSQTQTYTYDASDRIVSVCFQAGTCPGANDPFIRWTYDRVGNRLSEQRPGATTSYAYDARDGLLSAGSTSYTYDQNGNELSAGSRTFTYDLANRLKATTQGSTTTTYSYDGEGVRLQSSTGSTASKKTNFLWDVSFGLPQLARERDGAGNVLRAYLYGLRRITMGSGSTSIYLYDGLGSVANLGSLSGETQWTWSYEPFGSVRTETKAPGTQAPDNFMRFAGEYLDPTGLYHLRARQYDPGVGRLLTPDPRPAGLGTTSTSSYAYVRNEPTSALDPSGEVPETTQAGQDSAESATRRVNFVAPSAVDKPVPPGHCSADFADSVLHREGRRLGVGP